MRSKRHPLAWGLAVLSLTACQRAAPRDAREPPPLPRGAGPEVAIFGAG